MNHGIVILADFFLNAKARPERQRTIQRARASLMGVATRSASIRVLRRGAHPPSSCREWRSRTRRRTGLREVKRGTDRRKDEERDGVEDEDRGQGNGDLLVRRVDHRRHRRDRAPPQMAVPDEMSAAVVRETAEHAPGRVAYQQTCGDGAMVRGCPDGRSHDLLEVHPEAEAHDRDCRRILGRFARLPRGKDGEDQREGHAHSPAAMGGVISRKKGRRARGRGKAAGARSPDVLAEELERAPPCIAAASGL